MNDNDLIRRGDVYKAIYALHADGKEGIMNAPRNSYGEDLRDVIDVIGDIPAVPQEMSAKEYFKQIRRLQNWADQLQRQYHKASETLYNACDGNIDSAIEEVEKWAREHPERSEDDADV
jgi:hypothetical protein